MIDIKLNYPGRMARYFIESRLTTLMILSLLFIGFIGLNYTPREENPQIIVPAVEISVPMPGASPLEVEHILLSPLEADLAAIKGVKHTYGTALTGLAKVMVEFEVGEGEESALVRINERLLRHQFPDSAGQPHIEAIDVDDVPVFTLTLASALYDDYQLKLMAERVLERLRSVQGVSLGYIVGGRNREIRLDVSPERLQVFGVTLNELVEQIAAADVSQPINNRVYEGSIRGMRIDGMLRSREDVETIAIRATNGRILHISDLADVVDGPPTERSHYTRLGFGQADPRFAETDGKEMAAVTIAISKRSGINAVELTQLLRDRVDNMRNGFLPPDVYTVISRDDGDKANRTVTKLIEHLFIAIAAVSVILWLFLGPRAALIVACTIPLVFAVVMGADLIAGPTLNRITLYALILALGMLVDDAIVVIENTHRHYHDLPPNTDLTSRSNAAILATHEIGRPTTLATITVVMVFLSLLLVTGMLGLYFYPVTFNVPVAMIASLVIAYTVTPWMARRWLPVGNIRQSRKNKFLDLYRYILVALLKHKALRRSFYFLIAGLLVAALLQPSWQFIRPQGLAGAVSYFGLPLAFLPKDDKNTFLVHIHLPETTPLELTDQAAREVENLLRKQSWITNYTTHVGIPAVVDFNGQLKGSRGHVGPQYAEIRVNLVDKDERDETSIELILALREDIERIAAGYPDGIIQLVEDPPGPPVRATIMAEVYGPDLETIDQLAYQVAEEFKKTWDMAETWASVPFDIMEYSFRIKRDKAILSGVDPAKVSQALKSLMDGQVVAYIHPEDTRQPVPVRGVVPRHKRIDTATLGRAYVENTNRERIPLSELVEVVPAVQKKPINHKNGERVQYVGGELADSAPVYAVLDLDHRLDNLVVAENKTLETANLHFLPVRANALEGYQLLWEGELRLTLDAFRDMGIALGLALVVIFLLLVGYYQSVFLPLLAMVPIPLGMIGVFPGHWIMGIDFSAASMIGVIALSGVVVRNSLLIIDFTRDLQQQGLGIDEAIVKASALRLRPIVLTTLAITLGTWIMVSDPVFGGLAIALIAGAISSAAFTVFVIPLLYKALYQFGYDRKIESM